MRIRWHKTARKTPRANLEQFLRNVASRGLVAETIVDVGANHAKWSTAARRVFPAAKFCLIEPQTEMRGPIEEFLAGSPGSVWIAKGADSACCVRTFTVRPDTVSSSFLEDADSAERAGWERRELECLTLDSLVMAGVIPIPEIVKIDAEGLDLQVVEGSALLLGKTEMFLLECPFFPPRRGGSTLRETLQGMEERGYLPYDFTEFVQRPHDGALGLCELAFVRKDGILRAYSGW